MNEPPSRWNPDMRPETPPPEAVQAHIGAPLPRGASRVRVEAGVDAKLEESPTSGEVASSRETEDSLVASSIHHAAFSIENLAEVELHAIIGAGSAFHGTLSFSGQVRIDGQLEGVARGGRLLVIGHGARVRGRIEADHVIVLGGRVEADIVASESIELHVPAEVRGDLKSPQIYMDRGVQFQGTCDMTAAPPRVKVWGEETEP
jgi:cytoskeletal protein CcmA (bactofilin family)